ncbi:PREDICTED: pentraxin-related protein PTX3 [Tinamus guttatus]|uniref:pentraxin-related protein PTX3 n=1 Tax=Tinamus guttatus TaxID=94827 RepID=UPI00052ECDCB|nr:PREDICTED: pentraxin-related protein PTX3 [Tinamus guttatus]
MLPQDMLSLLMLFCVFRASASALHGDDDYDLMYVNLDNEIEGPVLGPEETASCDCQREHTEWDKLFIMLENSQMKENMMLQAIDEILKVEVQALQAELRRLTGSVASAVTAAAEKATSLSKVLEHILQLSRNVSSRLGQLESAWRHGPEEDGDDFVLNALWKELQQTRAELKASQKWAAQHLLPAGCETAILFPMRSKKIFGSVHPTAAMTLRSFTACIWLKATEVLDKTIVFSYGTKMNPYEIQLYLSRGSAVLAVGSNQHRLTAQNVIFAGKWIHLCGAWSSGNGTATLWVNGELVATTSEIADAHTVPDGGILQLGQEKNGCCVGGGFDEALAFSGKLTGFNMWDRVLSNEEVAVQSGEDACSIRGNIIGWGVTEVLPYGGAQYVS